jgi:hypothetical protein
MTHDELALEVDRLRVEDDIELDVTLTRDPLEALADDLKAVVEHQGKLRQVIERDCSA